MAALRGARQGGPVGVDDYGSITTWENARRRRLLSDFRANVRLYFGSGDEDTDSARRELNLALLEVRESVLAAGVIPKIRWTPPALTADQGHFPHGIRSGHRLGRRATETGRRASSQLPEIPS